MYRKGAGEDGNSPPAGNQKRNTNPGGRGILKMDKINKTTLWRSISKLSEMVPLTYSDDRIKLDRIRYVNTNETMQRKWIYLQESICTFTKR